ncbi:MAG TPA: SGNH/GDSL hydrolase family protein [Dermatophilaceae bacterium]
MLRIAVAALAIGLGSVMGAAPSHAAPGEVLILDSTVTGGMASIEAQEVTALGLTPVLVDDAGWAAKTAADFANYRALVLGDATCSSILPTAAQATTATWGAAVTGNVLINGTDPVFHAGQGGDTLTRRAIDFALADGSKTGLYASLSCYYHGTAAQTPVPLLDGLRPGGFTVTGVGCYDDAHIVATHPALEGLTDATLSGWSCSVHEAFDAWPADFTVLALAKDFGAAFTSSDGTVGTPYILASGQGLRSFPLSVTPSSAQVSVGATHTVTATLLDSVTRQPAPGVLLRASAAAATGVSVAQMLNCSTPLCLTDANGHMSFSYSSTSPGDDVITVWNDKNADDRIDVGEAQVRASVTWVRTASTTWLALGDSYSAGVGNPGAADDPNNVSCRAHAAQSYSGQAETAAVAAGRNVAFKFAACMNAVTADILTQAQPGTAQLRQLDYVKANTPDVVTLTIGGNDIRFPAIAGKCVLNSVVPWLTSCPVDSNTMRLADPPKTNPTKKERASWDGLYDRLVSTYVAIRREQPSGGQLYVNSYPVPFSNPLNWSPITLGTCNTFSSREAEQANALAVRLGDTIYLAVQEANRRVGNGNVHFVDWRPPVTTQKIAGRTQRVAYDANGLCSRNALSESTMNGLLVPAPAGMDWHDSFHPTKRGYGNGASALSDALTRYSW